MAKRNYLVDGLSGTGKSSVYEQLIRRGYLAISTDRAWSHHETRTWVVRRAVGELECDEPDVLFVCGGGRDRDVFLPYFTKVLNLRIDDTTMRSRLEKRTERDWSLGQEGVELMLALNRSDEKPAGAIDVDATQPLAQVVEEVLRLADCAPNGSWHPAWAERDDVLPILLKYLEAQDIDITPGLDPSAFDPAELRRYYEEHSGVTAKGVGYAMADQIAFLRDTS